MDRGLQRKWLAYKKPSLSHFQHILYFLRGFNMAPRPILNLRRRSAERPDRNLFEELARMRDPVEAARGPQPLVPPGRENRNLWEDLAGFIAAEAQAPRPQPPEPARRGDRNLFEELARNLQALRPRPPRRQGTRAPGG